MACAITTTGILYPPPAPPYDKQLVSHPGCNAERSGKKAQQKQNRSVSASRARIRQINGQTNYDMAFTNNRYRWLHTPPPLPHPCPTLNGTNTKKEKKKKVPPPVRRNGELVSSIKIRLEGIEPHAQRVASTPVLLLGRACSSAGPTPGPVGRHDPAPVSGKLSQRGGQGGVTRRQQHVRRPV